MLSSLCRGVRTGAPVLVLLASVPALAAQGPRIHLGSKASEVLVAKITVANLRRSLDFYTQVVGLKEFQIPGVPRPAIDDSTATGGLYLNFSGSPAEPFLSLIKLQGVVPTLESAKLTWVGFKVVDTRAALRRAKAAGAPVRLEAKEFMGTVGGIVRDPDGYTIEFVEAPSVGADTVLATKVAALEAKVSYLSDRQQIQDVYRRYTRGFDRNDVALFRSAFWPGVRINYGTQSDSFEEFVAKHLKGKRKVHLITNEFVDLAGDVAHVESYVTEFVSKEDGKSMIIGGRLIDRLDRRQGEWRIAVTEFVPHFVTETNTALDAYIKAASWSRSECGLGTWDKRDPSYRRPLRPRVAKDIGPACAD